jgi:hypothetical protein
MSPGDSGSCFNRTRTALKAQQLKVTFNCAAVQSRPLPWYSAYVMDKEQMKEVVEAVVGAVVLGVGGYVLCVLMFCM